MTAYEATMYSRGCVTVPVEVRRKLGIVGAGTIAFCIRDEGNVVLYAKDNVPPDFKDITAWPKKDQA
jgi:bifunctional DNA-binding transcriptional regulator/antitoxin component of YhaV-PrlF toxin-antitoxin module